MSDGDVGQSNRGISRRAMLQGAVASAISSLGANGSVEQAGPGARTQLHRSGVRTIDIHAHYYPQAYLDLFNSEGRRFGAEFRMTAQGFFFKTNDESDGPLPTKFIDLKQRRRTLAKTCAGME
jgi:aminocarboxymuconate-semialdehyde decarboxylase